MLQSSKDRARATPVEESTEFRVPWGRFRRWYGQAPGMWLKFYAAGRLEISQGDTRADRGSEAVAPLADDRFSKFPIAVAIGR